jgi:O-antigen/teichoic acid export membrane protein
MLKALLPVLARIQHSKEEMIALTLKCMHILNALAFPVGVGLASVAAPATLIVLGEKWADAIPFVSVFALISILMVVPNPLATLLVAQGAVKARTWSMVAELVAFVVAAASFYPLFGLVGLAYARLAASACAMLVMIEQAKQICDVRRRDAWGTMWRPAAGAVIMGVSVQHVLANVHAPALQLVAGIGAGALVYALWSVTSWLALGRPVGLETTALDLLKSRMAKRTTEEKP